MRVSLDCTCGEPLRKDADFGHKGEIDTIATCEHCGRQYVCTITVVSKIEDGVGIQPQFVKETSPRD